MSDADPDDNDLDVLAGEYVLGVLSLDERHAVSLGRPTLSVGLGGSAMIARRPGEGNDASAV